jgi:hypothetical protein
MTLSRSPERKLPLLQRVVIRITEIIFGEGPRSTSYKRTAALRLLVQPCDKDDQFFSFFQVM